MEVRGNNDRGDAEFPGNRHGEGCAGSAIGDQREVPGVDATGNAVDPHCLGHVMRGDTNHAKGGLMKRERQR